MPGASLDLGRKDWRDPRCDTGLQNRGRGLHEECGMFDTKRRSAFPGHARSDLQSPSLGVLAADVQSQARQEELTDSY